MPHSLVWRDGQVVAQDFPLDDLDRHVDGGQEVVWYDLCAPDSVAMQKVAQELHFNPLAVEDAVAPSERAKATKYGTHTFITVYAVDLQTDPQEHEHASRLGVHRVSMFVLPRALITVRNDDGFDLTPVLKTWEENHELIRQAGVAALLHGLLDVVVDGHFETIQQLDDQCENVEDELFDTTTRPGLVQQRIFRLRKELVELRRIVLPMREIVATIQRHSAELHGDAGSILDPSWQDLMDHVLRASEWTESLRDMITSLFETNLSLQDARMNTVMKRLAGWGAVIAVPTAVTGWFGQNVPYPGFQNWFGLVLTCILTFGGSLVVYFLLRHYDWI